MKVLTVALFSLLVAVASFACDDGGGSDGPLPDDFPVYEDSDLTVSNDENYGLYETSDRGPDVTRSIQEQLDEGPWQAVGEPVVQGGQIVIRVENPEASGDEPDTGTIVIIDDGETTRIVEEVGRKGTTPTPRPDATDAPAATRTRSPSASNTPSANNTPSGSNPTPGSGSLPGGYPSERVPLPGESDVTSATAPENSGAELYLIEFSTGMTPDDVVAFYEQELADQGWSATLTTSSNGNFLLTYTDGDDSVTVSGSGDASGTTASITVVLAN